MDWDTCSEPVEPNSRNVSCHPPSLCISAQVPAAEALIVAPLEEVFVYLRGCSSTAPCKGSRSESGQIFRAGLSSDVLHAADFGISLAVEL